MPEEEQARLREEAEQRRRDTMLGVWPEHWRPVLLASAMRTQWRSAGMGGVVGLDYNAIPVVEARAGLPESIDGAEDDFAALQVIEAEMLRAFREK